MWQMRTKSRAVPWDSNLFLSGQVGQEALRIPIWVCLEILYETTLLFDGTKVGVSVFTKRGPLIISIHTAGLKILSQIVKVVCGT